VSNREQPGPIREQACPKSWVRESLFRFALARVDDPETAEDLVQETFLAALKAAPSFASQSSERMPPRGVPDDWRFGCNLSPIGASKLVSR